MPRPSTAAAFVAALLCIPTQPALAQKATATPQAPQAKAQEKLCSNATITTPGAEMFVTAGQSPGQAPKIDWIVFKARSADKSFGLWVQYALAEPIPGQPTSISVYGYAPLPDPSNAAPERLAFQIGDGAWSTMRFAETPRRSWGDPSNIEGFISYYPPRSSGNTDLGALDATPQVSFRRLDAGDKVLAEGVIVYPSRAVIDGLYAKARQKAFAALKPCQPPLMIPPVKERVSQ